MKRWDLEWVENTEFTASLEIVYCFFQETLRIGGNFLGRRNSLRGGGNTPCIKSSYRTLNFMTCLLFAK